MGKERRRLFGSFTIRQKLIIYVLSILMPVLLFSIVYLAQSQKILQEKAGTLMAKSLELSTSWMDETLTGAVRLSAIVESEYVTRNFLLEHQELSLEQRDVLDISAIQKQLDDILRSESRATSIWIYFSDTNEVISTQFGIYEVSDYNALSWLKSQTANGKIKAWIYPDGSSLKHAGSLHDFAKLQENGNLQISFVRSIPGFGSTDKPIIIGVGYLEYTLQDLLSEAAEKTNSSLMLINGSGHNVLQAGTRLDHFPSLNLSKWDKENNYLINNDMLITRSKSSLTGWDIVSAAPLNDYMGGLTRLNSLTWAFSISAVIIALWLGVALTRDVHRPLKKLMAGMKKMEAGDLSARVSPDQNDEFGKVALGFNRMAETQENLIRTVYQERIARQDAELSYLTAQINPHFLYNTLGALYSMAKRVDATLASSLLAMSRLFRSSLNQGKEMMTVSETVEHISNYVHLLNIRNPDKYRMELYVEPGTETEMIPSLIVQPIVENSVKHGLETLPGQGIIRISFTLLTAHLLITISDNGSGMPQEQLERLQRSIREFVTDDTAEEMSSTVGADEIGNSGYALRNIFRRLHLKYGTNFVFQIHSEEGKGTHLNIRIPRKDDRA
jgi:two-component system, sensor histidine kinase YesM